MTFRTLLLFSWAALAYAGTTHVPRPNPPLNSNPTDTSQVRLNGKAFPFNALPFKADTSTTQPGVVFRGDQAGYNRCNSTTEGPNSLCQTILVNSIDDFCFFAPQDPNSSIGDTEGEEVAWCTKAGHGARQIPAGTFTGLQFLKSPSYVAVMGKIDGTKVNIKFPDDGGGELDSGGQDQRGNPIGGLAYSTNLPSAGGQPTQSRAWHLFISETIFCMKLCDPTAPDASGLCEHVFDTLGCNYNVPGAYVDNLFLSCESADQDPVGVFTGADGNVSTFKNPGEGVAPNPPFQPRIPATSACTTFQSASLFAGAPTATGVSTSTSTTTVSSSTTTSGTTTKSGVSSGSGTGTASGSGSSATTTGAASSLVRGGESGALQMLLVSGAAVLLGAAIYA